LGAGDRAGRRAFVYDNPAALRSNFAAVGADRLILSALVENRSDVEGVSHAVPGSVVTIARLPAPLPVLKSGSVRARCEEQQPEDFVVESDARPFRGR
jgi:hypothetical protein